MKRADAQGSSPGLIKALRYTGSEIVAVLLNLFEMIMMAPSGHMTAMKPAKTQSVRVKEAERPAPPGADANSTIATFGGPAMTSAVAASTDDASFQATRTRETSLETAVRCRRSRERAVGFLNCCFDSILYFWFKQMIATSSHRANLFTTLV